MSASSAFTPVGRHAHPSSSGAGAIFCPAKRGTLHQSFKLARDDAHNLVAGDRTRSRTTREVRRAKSERWRKASEWAQDRAQGALSPDHFAHVHSGESGTGLGESRATRAWSSKPRWKGQSKAARGRPTRVLVSPVATDSMQGSGVGGGWAKRRRDKANASPETRAVAKYKWRSQFTRDFRKTKVAEMQRRREPASGNPLRIRLQLPQRLVRRIAMERGRSRETELDRLERQYAAMEQRERRLAERRQEVGEGRALPRPWQLREADRMRDRRVQRELENADDTSSDGRRSSGRAAGCAACAVAALHCLFKHR